MLPAPPTVPLTKIVPPFAPVTMLSFTYVPPTDRSTLPSIQMVPLIDSCDVVWFQARWPITFPAWSRTVQSKSPPVGRSVVVGVVPFCVVSESNAKDPVLHPPPWETFNPAVDQSALLYVSAALMSGSESVDGIAAGGPSA